jgi:hypothetical protein
MDSEKGFAGGGISTGPESGHWEKLHGTEAIIPMEGGNIPVKVIGSDDEEVKQLLRENLRYLKKIHKIQDRTTQGKNSYRVETV